MKALEHFPHSPDLVPDDCYLLPGLKSALKGRLFCDATTLIKNTTEELKRHSQNGFKNAGTNLQSLTAVCICRKVVL